MARVTFRLTAAGVAMLVCPACFAQGDVFSSNTGGQQLDSCDQAFNRANQQMFERRNQSRFQWERDFRACQGDAACELRAQDQFRAREGELNREFAKIKKELSDCKAGLSRDAQKSPQLKGGARATDRNPNSPAGGRSTPGVGGGIRSGTGNPNGGYNPNTPSAPRSSNPLAPDQYLRGYASGVQDGLSDCIHGFIDLGAAAGMVAIAAVKDQAQDLIFNATAQKVAAASNPLSTLRYINWQDAAKMLGVEPGKSMGLKELVDSKTVGVSAYDSGREGGRRLCAYGLIPGAAKAVHSAPGMGFTIPGETPVNPLRGKALSTAMTAPEKGLPAFSGKWISPGGLRLPIKLGAFKGKGSFSSVFENGNNPNQVVKIGNNTGESAASFERQKNGVARLKRAGVVTPNIYSVDPGSDQIPGVLNTDNISRQGPAGSMKMFRSDREMAQSPAAVRALQKLKNDLAAKGFAWADLKFNNVAFSSDGAGGLKAVVIDPDFVMTPQEFADSIRNGTMPGKVLGAKLFQTEGLQDWVDLQNGKPVSAAQLSNSLFDAWLKGAGFDESAPAGSATAPSGGGTAPQAPTGTVPRGR